MSSPSGKNPDLVFDVGMHKGEDTEFYLKKGFRVVGFEADPELAEYCRQRFPDAVKTAQLTIVEGAVTEFNGPVIEFHKNLDVSDWGTIQGGWSDRNEVLGTRTVTVEVSTVNFSDCLRRFGVPYYMKVDIEGSDLVCLRALAQLPLKPDYISLESEKVDFKRLRAEFQLLEQLGYTSFKAIDQSTVRNQRPPESAREGRYALHDFQLGSSGLFGRELPGEWRTRDATIREYRWIFLRYRLFGDRSIIHRNSASRWMFGVANTLLGGRLLVWYDTHARHKSADDASSETGLQ